MTIDFLKIDSIDDERISFFKSLRLASNRFKDQGLFLVEGEISFEALLNTPHSIHSIFLEESLVKKYETMLPSKLLNDETRYLFADRTLMTQVVGYSFHQGVLALAYRPLLTPCSDLSFPAIALNAIENAENIVNVIRISVFEESAALVHYIVRPEGAPDVSLVAFSEVGYKYTPHKIS